VVALATGAGLTAALAVAVPGVASAAPAALPANCSVGLNLVTCTFGYTGAEQTFTVPPGTMSVNVTAIGAAGSANHSGAPGGEGARVTGTVTGLSGGQTLYVEVGQTVNTASLPELGKVAAFNGGGAGVGIFSGAGGGASDVRTIARTATGTLASRLIVAGGGGGRSETYEVSEPPASAGQNAQPAAANDGQGQGGFAGTQTAGGAGGRGALGISLSAECFEAGSGSAGSLGQGGNGVAAEPSSAGGGGGLYGGGGGGGGGGVGETCTNPSAAGGGGGGSSLVPAGGSQTLASSPASVTISYAVDADLAIASHPNITVNATSLSGAVVTYTAPAVTDPNGASPPAAVCTPASGSTFAIGTTTVTCTATDSDDLNSPVSTSFAVTVVADDDLAIASHPNITVDATSPRGATVTYTAPAVTDPDDASPPAAVCTPVSGSTFAIGTTTVTCTATDSDDLNSPVSTSFAVTVVADDDLAIASHPNITVNATSLSGAVVTYTAPAVTDPDDASPPAAVCTPASGSTFAIGTTTVTCTATDSDDLNSPVSTSFTVTVIGAAGQLAALYQEVKGFGPGLANTVLIAEQAVAAGNTGRACLALNAFVIEVATHIPPLPPATAAQLEATAGQIRAVLGC
jgi:Glycine rich protein/HYR domain